MSNFYCKYCGAKSPSVQSLVSGMCGRSPTKRHALYEGSEKSKYVCKYCGAGNPSIAGLTSGTCPRSPTKRHEPAL